MALQHLRSNTASKRPTPGSMSDGQLAINTNATSPGVFFKDAGGALIKVGPVHIGTSAPNSSPATGGETGNSIGEQWLDTSGGGYVFKVWDGTAWRSETGQFVDVAGDTMTGDLTISGADLVMSNGEIIAAAGAAATPSITFTGDTNTGIYSPGADQVAVSTGGTERLQIDASGNVGIGTSSPVQKLHVEGDGSTYLQVERTTSGSEGTIFVGTESAHNQIISRTGGTGAKDLRFLMGTSEAMRIDSSGRVGIGTSSPDQLLDIAASTDATIQLKSTKTGAAVNDVLGTIAYYGSDGSGPGVGVKSSITSTVQGTGGAGSDLRFHTTNSAGSNNTEKVRIDEQGNVGIGTTSPTQKLQITDGTLSNFYVAPGYGGGAGTTIGVGGGEYLAFNGAPFTTERMRIDSSGRLLVGTTTARSQQGITTKLNVENTDYDGLSIVVNGGSTASRSGSILMGRSGGTANGSSTLVSNNDRLGAIFFQGADGTDIQTGAGSIACFVDGTPGANDMPGRLVFSTTADGASSPTERMRLSSNGRLTAGSATSTVGSTLIENWYNDENRLNVIGAQQSSGATSICYAVRPKSGAVGYVSSAGNAAFRRAAIEVGADTHRHISFKYAPSATVAIDNDVSLTTIASFTSQGLAFGSDTAPQNSLDDYEEGTWTPESGIGTTSASDGNYTKIGNLVHVAGYIRFDDITTASSVYINNLPFNVLSGGRSTGSVFSGYTDAGKVPNACYATPTTNNMYFYISGTGTTNYASLLHSEISSTSNQFFFSATYRTT